MISERPSERPSQKPPIPDTEWDARAIKERDSRPERLARLNATVDRLFPGEKAEAVRAKIKASFNVPQWGEYHNEGLFMDTHLDLILQRLGEVRSGEMSESVPAEVRSTMQETSIAKEDVLEKYVFLHDISKMDTLLIKSKGPDGKAVSEKVTWEDWQARIPAEAQGDPVAMRAWLKSSGIEGISYYHPSDKTNVGKKHGDAGAEEARRLEVEVDPSVLVAIENHEVAYSFSKPSAKTYREYFGTMSEEEKAMALTASFIDTTASIGITGEPDISNFLALTASKRNDELLLAVEAGLPDVAGLDKGKLEKKMAELRKADRAFPEKDSAQLLESIKKECKKTEYNLEALSEALQDVVSSGQIGIEDKERIIELMRSGNLAEIGKQYGPKMRFITPALKAAEKK
jgi:hypothetical protein